MKPTPEIRITHIPFVMPAIAVMAAIDYAQGRRDEAAWKLLALTLVHIVLALISAGQKIQANRKNP